MLSSALAGAIAWGAFAVSLPTSAAVLGTAMVVYTLAKAVFEASDQVACQAAVVGGLSLGNFAIYYFALSSFSLLGAPCLIVGAFVINVPVHGLLFPKKDASPSPANQ